MEKTLYKYLTGFIFTIINLASAYFMFAFFETDNSRILAIATVSYFWGLFYCIVDDVFFEK